MIYRIGKTNDCIITERTVKYIYSRSGNVMLTVYSKTVCPHCTQAKQYLDQLGVPFAEINIEQDSQAREFVVSAGHRSVPQIYLNGTLFVEGGWQGLSKLSADQINARLTST